MRKKQIKTNKLNIIILLNIFVLGLIILFINDFGLIRYIRLNKKHKQLTQQLNTLLLQQTSLRKNIDQLQHDEEYIKKIAREKFMMVMPGEKVYRVINEKTMD